MKKLIVFLMMIIPLIGHSQKPMFVEAFSRQQDSTLDKLYSICRADSAILVVNHYDPNDTLSSIYSMDRMTQMHSFCIPSYSVGGYVIPDSLGTDWKVYNNMNTRYLTEITIIQASLTTFTFGGVYRLKVDLSEVDPSWSINIFIVEDFAFFKAVQRTYAKIPATMTANVDIVWRNNWTMRNCRIIVEIENQNRHTIGVRQITIDQSLNAMSTDEIPFNVNVYPNPCTDILKIESDQPLFYVKIINSTGQVLYDQIVNNYSLQFSMANFDNGLYFIQLPNKTYRVIKQ